MTAQLPVPRLEAGEHEFYDMHISRLEKNPDDAYSLIQLASLYGTKGDTETEFMLITRAVELVERIPGLQQHLNEPDFSIHDPYYCMAVYKENQDLPEEAIAWYQKSFDVATDEYDRADLLWRIGNEYFDLQKFVEARKYYEQAYSTVPDALLLNSIGFCYERLEDTEQAINYYLRAIHHSGQSDAHERSRFYANLGNAYRLKGNLKLAHKTIYKALSIDPNCTTSLLVLANMYLFSFDKDIDIAEALYKRVLRKEPENYMALQNLGVLYQFDRHDLQAARQYYQKSFNVFPHYHSCRQLATIHALLSEEDELRVMIEYMMEHFPDELEQDFGTGSNVN